jgi:hypothetical protein
MAISKAECEAKGFIRNDETRTCTMPKIKLIKMTIGRGVGCDGGARAVVIRRRLALDVQKALIKAAKPPRRSRRPAR